METREKQEEKRSGAIVGGRCGVLVQDYTTSGRVCLVFFVKNSLEEARAFAKNIVYKGLKVGICKRSSTNYKNKRLVSVNYRIIARYIPSRCSYQYEKYPAGGWVDCVFNAVGDNKEARWVAVTDDSGGSANTLDGLALGTYNGRAVWY